MSVPALGALTTFQFLFGFQRYGIRGITGVPSRAEARGAPRQEDRLVRRSMIAAMALGLALSTASAGLVAAHPDNDHSLHFVLTCDDGHVWDASINGGSSSFHLNGVRLYVWKRLDYVTPDGISGSISHGIQGFAAAPLVVCTYTGAISGNAYTVTGFYPPAS